MKKVVLVTETYYPHRKPTTIEIWQAAKVLRKVGWDVTIITIKKEPSPDYRCLPEDMERFTRGFDIRRVGSSTGPLQGLRFALSAALLARRLKPTLCYSRSLYQALLASLLGIPVMYESHQELELRRLRLTAFLLARQRRCLGFVAISSGMAECLRSYGIPQHKILVEHDGVDEEFFRHAQSKPVPAALRRGPAGAAPFTVGYVGHLHPDRGIEVLLEAGARLPKVQFFIVGGADSVVRQYSELCQKRGLTNVKFVGHVPYDEVPSWLISFDALVIPYSDSLGTRRTTSPLKLLEYMASGRPIIASDLPTLREVLTPEKTALLVTPDNPEKLAEAIQRLISQRALGESLGQEAARTVPSYTWEQRYKRILEFGGFPGE